MPVVPNADPSSPARPAGDARAVGWAAGRRLLAPSLRQGRRDPAVRSVIRHTEHRIIRDSETAPTVVASCLSADCGWSAVPGPDVAAVDRQCMTHTGLNQEHTRFLRGFEDIAVVHRVEKT
ncbi:DUF7848 domain-containing protein [Streptomyces avidinii]